ncbi:hypothetical protein GGI15_000780 [Coemansia interrupta]|uniref:Velvet domain-containing protein n=1 Tax=Coemansia interrupta TaxID=1126814 RepID=A0A9W8LP79_9FUNG|nr:hypothetical protein GGI15_000780 [Coemansia interrupta]
MDTEMDLIRQQRAPHESGHGSSHGSGHGSSTSGTTAVNQFGRNIHPTTGNSSLTSGNDTDGTMINSPAVGSMFMGSMPTTLSSNPRIPAGSGSGNDNMVVYPPSVIAAGAPSRGLGQHLANSSSIMSFSAGNDSTGAPDSGNEGSSGTGGNYSNSDSPVCTVRNLIGASVTTGAKLNNVDGSPGIFFVFPDLSIRKDGEYRFRFSFFDLKSSIGDLLRTSAYIKARTFSDPFKVYSAKQFPGMIESTELSKHFAKQGVKIPVRKETVGKNRNSPDDDDWPNN